MLKFDILVDWINTFHFLKIFLFWALVTRFSLKVWVA